MEQQRDGVRKFMHMSASSSSAPYHLTRGRAAGKRIAGMTMPAMMQTRRRSTTTWAHSSFFCFPKRRLIRALMATLKNWAKAMLTKSTTRMRDMTVIPFVPIVRDIQKLSMRPYIDWQSWERSGPTVIWQIV